MNTFVQVISADATPGRLFGPMEYAEAEQVLRALLVAGQNENGPVEITAEVEEAITDDGFWTFENGGGVYIVASEPFYGLDDEEGYTVEDDTVFHSQYTDPLGEFQDGRFVPSRFLLELPAEAHKSVDDFATNYLGERAEDE